MIIYLGQKLLLGSSELPILLLHQVGFTAPSISRLSRVRSYRTISPLPVPSINSGHRLYAFCCTFPKLKNRNPAHMPTGLLLFCSVGVTNHHFPPRLTPGFGCSDFPPLFRSSKRLAKKERSPSLLRRLYNVHEK